MYQALFWKKNVKQHRGDVNGCTFKSSPEQTISHWSDASYHGKQGYNGDSTSLAHDNIITIITICLLLKSHIGGNSQSKSVELSHHFK